MTEAPKTPKPPNPIEPIIELVEVVHLRYLVAAAIIGLAVGIAVLYVLGQRMNGTEDDGGS